MSRISTLQYNKRYFNPKNLDDLKLFKKFYSKHRWDGPCPFFLEWPYADIPSMMLDKIVSANIDSIIKTKKKPVKQLT